MTVGQRIQARRQELNLSVDDLAERIGKNRATVYRYESEGIKNLPVSVLEDIARALRTTPGYLLTQDSDEPALSQDEENLVSIYQALDEYGKDIVMTVAQKELDRCKDQEESQRRDQLHKLLDEQLDLEKESSGKLKGFMSG